MSIFKFFNKFFPSISIEDPAGRLPDGARSILPLGLAGKLIVPDRGVPVHEESLITFATQMDRTRRLCFVPEVPISSELGLPAWEPLLYWVPEGAYGDDEDAPFERVVETTGEERVHYFVQHYGVISPKPIQVSVVVANVCNLACVMCPYHSPEIKPDHTTGYFDERQWMSWDVLDRIASECGEHGIPVKMGNIEEPLLHPRIIEFVKICRERGVPTVHITTNGTPLNERRIRELFEAGVTSMYVSIDASRPETYSRVRGGDLKRVERNMRNLLRLRKELESSCSIQASFVKNKGVSMEEVDEFRDRWVEEADGVILYNLVEYESGASQVNEVYTLVQERLEEAGGRWACLSPFQEIYVLPDGQIYYCCETIGKLAFEELESMGHYPDQNLMEIWRGAGFSRLRRDLLLDELEAREGCRDCGIWMAHVTSTEESQGRRISRNMITEITQQV